MGKRSFNMGFSQKYAQVVTHTPDEKVKRSFRSVNSKKIKINRLTNRSTTREHSYKFISKIK